MKTLKPNWAMLAVDIDAVTAPLFFPMIAQPKLNGVRAGWFPGEGLFTRQGKRWSEKALPHIYNKLQHEKLTLDGELYCHNLPFQDVCALAAVNRKLPHKDHIKLEFRPFDIIDDKMPQKERLQILEKHYGDIFYNIVFDQTGIEHYLLSAIEDNYEGLMLRKLSAPYFAGRTEALIKVKPWQKMLGTVVGMTEGLGKYKGMLGALVCKLDWFEGKICMTEKVHVSGGLTDEHRRYFWNLPAEIIGRLISIKYRELSKKGIPLKPQILSLKP